METFNVGSYPSLLTVRHEINGYEEEILLDDRRRKNIKSDIPGVKFRVEHLPEGKVSLSAVHTRSKAEVKFILLEVGHNYPPNRRPMQSTFKDKKIEDLRNWLLLTAERMTEDWDLGRNLFQAYPMYVVYRATSKGELDPVAEFFTSYDAAQFRVRREKELLIGPWVELCVRPVNTDNWMLMACLRRMKEILWVDKPIPRPAKTTTKKRG